MALLKKSEGHIYVASKVNRGAKFNIFLPIVYISHETDKEEDSKEIETLAEIKGNSIILLIEDEESVREFTTKALTRKGFSVIEAVIGSKALEIVRKKNQHIDLIITDVIMPEVMVQKELKKHWYIDRISVIFIFGDEINIEDFHFLPKPFTLNGLGNKAQSVLHKTKKGSLLWVWLATKTNSNAKVSCTYTIELFYT